MQQTRVRHTGCAKGKYYTYLSVRLVVKNKVKTSFLEYCFKERFVKESTEHAAGLITNQGVNKRLLKTGNRGSRTKAKEMKRKMYREVRTTDYSRTLKASYYIT